METNSHTTSLRRGSKCLTCFTDWKQNILPVATRGESVWEQCLKFGIFPLALSLDRFHCSIKQTQGAPERRFFRKKWLSPNCHVILLRALCSYIIILALLPSTILLPRVQTLLWYLTSLPRSHPSEIVVWIYNPLEPNPLKLWSNCQNTVHQSIRLSMCNIPENPQRERNTFLKN